MATHRKALGLPLVLILADLVKAFPRTWRHYALLSAEQFLMLEDMLEQNSVFVTESGLSELSKLRGLSEGGYLGTLLYPFLPDGLARSLEDRGSGPGMLPDCGNSIAMLDPCSEQCGRQMRAADEAADWRIPILLHADDQALPASSLQTAQETRRNSK